MKEKLGRDDVNLIIASVVSIMLIFGVVYGLIVLFRTVGDLPLKRRINQMQCFAEDLQSTMDMEQLGWLTSLESIINEDN